MPFSVCISVDQESEKTGSFFNILSENKLFLIYMASTFTSHTRFDRRLGEISHVFKPVEVAVCGVIRPGIHQHVLVLESQVGISIFHIFNPEKLLL